MPKSKDPSQEFYTLGEVGKKLGLSRMTVYRYVIAKRIPAYKFGKHYRVRSDDLDSFISQYKV